MSKPKSVLDLMTEEQIKALLAVYESGVEDQRHKTTLPEYTDEDVLAINEELAAANEAYELLAATIYPQHASSAVLAAIASIA